MGQMFTNDVHFTKFYLMRAKSEAPDALISFMQDIGIPSALHSDDAKELTQGHMGELLRKFWLKGTQSEPYSPWQVRTELCIKPMPPNAFGITVLYINVNCTPTFQATGSYTI
jgi:hypothetical protein